VDGPPFCYRASMRAWLGTATATTLATLLLSCDACDRDGCYAMEYPARFAGTGIAGAVATSSDIITNECHECPFGRTQLELYQIDEPVTDQATAAAIAAGTPFFSFPAVERYVAGVGAGLYLVCATGSCVSVEVVSGETLTVNIHVPYGYTTFYVAAPGQKPEEQVAYFVGYDSE